VESLDLGAMEERLGKQGAASSGKSLVMARELERRLSARPQMNDERGSQPGLNREVRESGGWRAAISAAIRPSLTNPFAGRGDGMTTCTSRVAQVSGPAPSVSGHPHARPTPRRASQPARSTVEELCGPRRSRSAWGEKNALTTQSH
jgi:hypothetical protein